MGVAQSVENTKHRIKDGIEDEIMKRMMLQREVQMALNIAKARDTLHIFGTLWATFVGAVSIGHLAGHNVPKVASIPCVIGGIVLGNLADMAYGNKLARVSKEAEHILLHERARLVPYSTSPISKYYTPEERAIFYDKATAVGDLAPFSTICRHFVPKNPE